MSQARIDALEAAPGYQLTDASGIDRTGLTVVGSASGYHMPGASVRWDGSALSLIDQRPGSSTGAAKISGDGSTIVGRDGGGFTERTSAVLWRNGGPAQYLVGQRATDQSIAMAVSHDGSAVAGYTWTDDEYYSPFRYREASGVEYLPIPDGASAGCLGISMDGDRVFGTLINGNTLYTWDEDHGTRLHTSFSTPNGLTPDSRYVFGGNALTLLAATSRSMSEDGGVDYLPMLPGDTSGYVSASNYDGSMLAGISYSGVSPQRAFFGRLPQEQLNSLPGYPRVGPIWMAFGSIDQPLCRGTGRSLLGMVHIWARAGLGWRQCRSPAQCLRWLYQLSTCARGVAASDHQARPKTSGGSGRCRHEGLAAWVASVGGKDEGVTR